MSTWLGRGVVVMRLALSAAFFPCLGACSIITEDVGQPLKVRGGQLAQAGDYHQVLDFFGPPHRLSVGPAGMVFLYEEIDVNELQFGINLSGRRATLFKAVVARGNADRRLLHVSFDADGVTQAIRYQERDDSPASGAALQFIFAIAGVVDDDDLSVSPPAHDDWGFGLLDADLPLALNRRQSLDMGRNGLQQQATPVAVGQHTLELRPR